MVAATDNKRGRPSDKLYKEYIDYQENHNGTPVWKSNRSIQNMLNAEVFLTMLCRHRDKYDIYDFFQTNDCCTKHMGIAEQLGRMMRDGLLSDEEAIEQAEKCKIAYERGMSSKEIEKSLRQWRMSLKKEQDH